MVETSLQSRRITKSEPKKKVFCICVRYTFSSNHNIHKGSCGLCFWASDPYIERIYQDF